jgi:hypothetical protein
MAAHAAAVVGEQAKLLDLIDRVESKLYSAEFAYIRPFRDRPFERDAANGRRG